LRTATPLLAVLSIWFSVSAAAAKPPTLDRLFPAGARRGESVDVTASGQFDHWPVRVWASTPGVKVEPGGAKGTLKVSVANGVPPGVCWLRLADDEGATAPRPFVVGTLAEVMEAEPNDEPAKAQRLDRPAVTVNGRLVKPGDVDSYAVRLARGQTLVASMEANRRLGSPMDGVLQVVSPAGFVLAQNDDDHDHDPQVVFEAPDAGEYVVRTFAFPANPDSSIRFAGAESYVYRLTLTTGGFLDHPYPFAVARSGPTRVEAVGWNVPESVRFFHFEPRDDADPVRVDHALIENAAEVRVVPHASVVESEPNNADHPQAIETPVSVTGRIDPPRDVDVYQFPARKGQVLVVRVESRSLGQPLDAALRMTDAAGKVVSEADDSSRGRDPEFRVTVPADGTYRVAVRDLNGQGGRRYAYLLTVETPRPDFSLTLKADQFTVTPGKTLDVPVTVARANGFDGAIEVGLAEPVEGVTVKPQVSEPKGPSAGTVTLKVEATEHAASGVFRVVGKAPDGHKKTATFAVPGLSASLPSAWLTVVKAPPKPSPAK